jgi:hypothetical protein
MKSKTGVYLIMAISLFVAALHFMLGPDYQGFLKNFMRGYVYEN